MAMFPREILERILYFCDGRTIKNARLVSSDWYNIVDYLTERTDVWKRCCKEEIPPSDLSTYAFKYENAYEHNKWLNIYDTWLSWYNVKNNIGFDTVLCPVEVPRITCIAVSGNYRAIGSDDGRVNLYNNHWELLYSVRYLAVKITNLGFIDDDYNKYAICKKPILLIAYKVGTILINDFDGKLNELEAIQDVKLHSIYKDYLCYEQRGGHIMIVKLHRDLTGKLSFDKVTYVRIFSPTEVSSMHISHDFATFLLHNEVKIIKYSTSSPIADLQHKAKITFTVKNYYRLERSYQIYQDNTILSVCNSEDLGNQFLELFILGDKGSCSQKLFDTWDVFQANVTCMFLYGSVFVVGVDIGNVYFYHVSSWKWRSFDLRNYDKKVIIGRHPIISIDAVENKYERIFYVSSSFNIHKVVCYRTCLK